MRAIGRNLIELQSDRLDDRRQSCRRFLNGLSERLWARIKIGFESGHDIKLLQVRVRHEGARRRSLPPFAERTFMEFSDVRRSSRNQSGLAPENLTTLPHFSVSSAMSFPKSAGEPASTSPARSASRAFILGSVRPAAVRRCPLNVRMTARSGPLHLRQLKSRKCHKPASGRDCTAGMWSA